MTGLWLKRIWIERSGRTIGAAVGLALTVALLGVLALSVNIFDYG